MEYWHQKLFPMKYCSDIWFLHTTGLLRHQFIMTKIGKSYNKILYYFGLITFLAFLWSLWPFNLNWWLFQLKLLHMIHISWKNYEILKFWVLDFGFGLQNFFWPLKVFLRSLVSKKSSGMQKSYIWAVFHAKQFLMPIFHSGSLWLMQRGQ